MLLKVIRFTITYCEPLFSVTLFFSIMIGGNKPVRSFEGNRAEPITRRDAEGASEIAYPGIVITEPTTRSVPPNYDIVTDSTSQEVLTVVIDRDKQNFDPARDMTDHEYAVRDLRLRVAASNHPRTT